MLFLVYLMHLLCETLGVNNLDQYYARNNQIFQTSNLQLRYPIKDSNRLQQSVINEIIFLYQECRINEEDTRVGHNNTNAYSIHFYPLKLL